MRRAELNPHFRHMTGPRLHRGARGKIFNFARILRKRETAVEDLLWKHLKGRQLKGYKFRRQHPIGNFIADFYCHEALLIIELDGSVHEGIEAQQSDDGRTYELNQLGIKVIRFKNWEVMNNISKVLEQISTYLIPGPSPEGEGGVSSPSREGRVR